MTQHGPDGDDRGGEHEAAALHYLAERLHPARTRAGLTQGAARAETDYRRCQRLEHGAVNATFRILARLASKTAESAPAMGKVAGRRNRDGIGMET